MADAVVDIPVDLIDPDPQNPRGELSDDDVRVREFAEQLSEHKTIYQPLRVLKAANRYRIVIGERRWRAARLAGLEHVPVIIEENLSDLAVREEQLAEMAQQSEVPKFRQYEVWADFVSRLTDSGMSRKEAIAKVAKVVGKSERNIAGVIGTGYVQAPKALKALVEAGEIGPSVVGLLNGTGIADDDRVKLAQKIGSHIFKTTGTTIQSELMPRIRLGDDIANRLIHDPLFSLDDARRADEGRALARRDDERREKLKRAKERESERPRTMGEISFEIEGDLVLLTAKLRSLNELNLVEHLRLQLLKPGLLLFNEQWEMFKQQIPDGFLEREVPMLRKGDE